MTFEPERYRASLKPLELSHEQEDELLRDLWSIMETLYDHMDDPQFYPLHSAIADSAFDALDDAIALGLLKEEQERGDTPRAADDFNLGAKEKGRKAS